MNLEEPKDGFTEEERYFVKLTVLVLYSKISDPIDKFIFIAINESGYSQEEVGSMLRISQEAVSKRYKNSIDRLRDFRKRGIL